jgi:DNA repair exonuclease SbcCD ATPase subunit
MSTIQEWDQAVSKLRIQAETAKARYAESKQRLSESQETIKAVEAARQIVQTIAQSIQEQAHAAIAAVVSRCLSAVFEEPYEFKILFEQKRGRTEAVMVFERNGLHVDPMTASGGGVVDVAAFALRLACIMLKRPAARRVLIFDEPFKSPSPHYRERIKQLIETLAEEMDVQFVIVTNILELAAGNVIDLEQL